MTVATTAVLPFLACGNNKLAVVARELAQLTPHFGKELKKQAGQNARPSVSILLRSPGMSGVGFEAHPARPGSLDRQLTSLRR